ncbi:hypothetical protein ACU8KH_01632 [Lachancea thermotolerans]
MSDCDRFVVQIRPQWLGEGKEWYYQYDYRLMIKTQPRPRNFVLIQMISLVCKT